MSRLLKSIQTASCLVLDKRWESYLELYKEFQERLGIWVGCTVAGDGKTVQPELYARIDDNDLPPYIPDIGILYQTWYSRPNAYNAYKTHKMMLEDALSHFDNVLMVEDDTFLEPDFEEILAQTEDFFLTNPWEMIYFGAYHQETKEVAPHILKVNGSGGFHCVLLKTHLIPEILSYGPIGPIDWIVGKYIQPKYNCYAIHPSIASQKDGHSYVEGHHLSKPPRDQK